MPLIIAVCVIHRDYIVYLSIDVCVMQWDCKVVDNGSWCNALRLHC